MVEVEFMVKTVVLIFHSISLLCLNNQMNIKKKDVAAICVCRLMIFGLVELLHD